MRLTSRDGAATILTGGIVALYVALLAEANLPLVSGPRALAAAVLVLGLGACALGGGDMPAQRPGWKRVLGTLGGLAFAAALVTIITGSEAVLALLVATTVLLWLAATARHLARDGSRRARSTMTG